MKLATIQKHLGIPADGIIGPQTLRAIGMALGIEASPSFKSGFDRWIVEVLKHEGGYVNHPRDPGGATNMGIIQRTYNSWRRRQGKPIRSVRHISEDEVHAIYKREYWDKVRGDDLPPGVDYAVFDFAVNSGVSRSVKYLQKLVGAAQDGKIGPATISATRTINSRALVNMLCDARLSFMQRIRGGSLWKTFGRGWKRRVDGVRAKALGAAS